MPFMSLDEQFWAHVPDPNDFSSPFPSTFDSPRFAALGGMQSGALAAKGAFAWTQATQIAMKQKAHFVGDLREDWLPQLIKLDPGTEAFSGFFAQVSFPNSTDMAVLQKQLVDSGFSIGSAVLSAVPVYGQALGAILAAGRFFAELLKQPEKEQKYLVPWQEYSQGLDEDLCKAGVLSTMHELDWSRMFWPALDWEQGFRMFETEEGENTRAWGTFASTGGAPRYTTNAPGPIGGGLGFMPGTQKMADVVQLALRVKEGPTSRMDAITPVGDFYPATSQAAMALWEMVRKPNNPDMYKVRSGQCTIAWRQFFIAMRAGFKEAFMKAYHQDDRDRMVELGKIVSPFLVSGGQPVDLSGLHGLIAWPGMSKKGGAWQPDPNDGRPACAKTKKGDWEQVGWLSDWGYQAGYLWPPDRCLGVDAKQMLREKHWRWLDQAYILPTLGDLKLAQHRALYRTTICAYVRPRDLPGMPAYAAFKDTTNSLEPGHTSFGAELVARCEHARDVLLNHPLRFRIRLGNVDAVDPPYAQKLRDAGVTETSWKQPVLKVGSSTGLGDAPPLPPNDAPGGGVPFQTASIRLPGTGGGAGVVAAAALALGLGGIALKAAKG